MEDQHPPELVTLRSMVPQGGCSPGNKKQDREMERADRNRSTGSKELRSRQEQERRQQGAEEDVRKQATWKETPGDSLLSRAAVCKVEMSMLH